jgi:hypothetical protein
MDGRHDLLAGGKVRDGERAEGARLRMHPEDVRASCRDIRQGWVVKRGVGLLNRHFPFDAQAALDPMLDP